MKSAPKPSWERVLSSLKMAPPSQALFPCSREKGKKEKKKIEHRAARALGSKVANVSHSADGVEAQMPWKPALDSCRVGRWKNSSLVQDLFAFSTGVQRVLTAVLI